MKEKNGITLIALVITIIVLLILAGVALATLTGQGNIISNAENAVGKYNNSVSSEQQLLNEIEKYFQNYLEGENGATPPEAIDIPEVDENGLALENTTITTDEENVQIVIPKGFAPVILKGSNSTYSLPGQDGSVKEIMPADQWRSITSEQINQGIVIVDNAITYDNGQITGTVPDFNEYVWIPIPDDTKFKRIAWTTRFGYDENGVYGDGGTSGRTQFLSLSAELNKTWDNKIEPEYSNMVDSIDKNKGFYIGRYEASEGSTEKNVQSKRQQNPWTYISQGDAISSCKNNIDSINMLLMYGIQWDSILNWLINNAVIGTENIGKTKIMDLEDIQGNSNAWANFGNSIGGAAVNNGIVQKTGSNEYWKANNIYDLAGNVSEWTQERYSTGNAGGYRGGNYGDGIPESSDDHPVAFRSHDSDTVERAYIRITYQFFCNK